MKFIITESKIEKIIFRFLDMKDYNIVKKKYSPILGQKKTKTIVGTYYHFVLPGNNYSDIRYSSWDGRLFITTELIEEVMNMFSIEDDDTLIYISEWVEKQLEREIDVLNVSYIGKESVFGLDIFDL